MHGQDIGLPINGDSVAASDSAIFDRRCDAQRGDGRFGGTAGIDAFTELRWITIEDADQHYPI